MEAYLKSPVSKSLVVVVAIFEALATFFVALRFYLRVKLRQGVKWDDWLALLSLIASWGYAIGILIVASQVGVDWVKVDPLTAAKRFVEAVSIGSILLPFVITPIKISVLLFYKRIFTTRLFKLCVCVAISIVSAWGIATLVAQLLIADPVPSSSWTDLEDPKYRFDYFKFGLSVPVLSIIFDGIILLFPLAPLRKLQVPRKRKIAIIGTFWLGSFCLVTGAIRIHYWYKNAELLTNPNNTNVNKWQYDTLVQIWVFLEMTVSIVAACLPTLGPILTRSVYTHPAERISSLSSPLRRSGRSIHQSKDQWRTFERFDSGNDSGEISAAHKNGHGHSGRYVDVMDVEMARILADCPKPSAR